MKAWLVVGRAMMDDVPLKLFDNEKDANAFAQSVTAEMVMGEASRIYDTDVTTANGVWIIPFTNGSPEVGEMVKELNVEEVY